MMSTNVPTHMPPQRPNRLDNYYRLRDKATREEIEQSCLEVIKAQQLKRYEADGKVLSSCTSQCVICLDDYNIEDEVRVMKCHHAFHRGCIDEWMKTMQNNCPACRSRGVPFSCAMSADQRDMVVYDSVPRQVHRCRDPATCPLLARFPPLARSLPLARFTPPASSPPLPSLPPLPSSPPPASSYQPSLASRITEPPTNSHQPSLASRITQPPTNSRSRRHRDRNGFKTNQSRTGRMKRTRAQRYRNPMNS